MDRNVPQHIAIIMDGNGRWAKEKNRPRTAGHYQGTENVRNIAIKANDMGVKVLTLYAFSTENWKRPQEEVNYLMGLPAIFITKFLKELMEKGIKIATIGDLSAFPESTRKVLEEAMEKTRDNKNMTLVFAMNYGGRKDIVDGINRYVDDYVSGRVREKMTEELFNSYLSTAEYPEIDLMIRTSLDYRLSNFLLWQLSYTELYFTDTYWPDFTPEEFEKAINNFTQRSRRFGGLKDEN
ncbi:MAG: isoprenyl transferase [Erysipelotrichaceae bacterium]|jgi:undecaprenyl diphosphate synthase|nr:isoprenyl transferase [Erysipelotrichaceae bacterium]MBQ2684961.1 isoprenyl transferase [Erysipelotrichaceae bacterium]MBR2791737.1 isoprenyl transferase [Erysipelotrichaceae bacterium]MBR3352471.1 isoprenyl transferase [Erysipelotrichaceae bacterium]MBR6958752.1 isoprenyl transferase [Erysipelotrichaceae bacterium]